MHAVLFFPTCLDKYWSSLRDTDHFDCFTPVRFHIGQPRADTCLAHRSDTRLVFDFQVHCYEDIGEPSSIAMTSPDPSINNILAFDRPSWFEQLAYPSSNVNFDLHLPLRSVATFIPVCSSLSEGNREILKLLTANGQVFCVLVANSVRIIYFASTV